MKRSELVDSSAIKMPTLHGNFQMMAYETEDPTGQPTLVLVKGDVLGRENVLVRFHSECLTGDVFGSLRCDCGLQLQHTMQMIEEAGSGVIIYLRQEGRGIGLVNKMKAYRLQEQGLDTVEANERLDLPVDAREYDACKVILDDLGVASIRLITNNPDKIDKALALGINVQDRVEIEIEPFYENKQYMITKKIKMGHLLSEV
ncbi:GTP cyclohydrolase II [Tumebacillus avium]|uniref:GTP cyclohydrolase-2 n=1 Tax=Tumebacillus avium TaxID=1903704 RepID=A0A1Y0IL01_9BACL|nr:GTP cyclohydrolase II [Tumebacillus avium]ARU61177.1 GTP cyclohydrolase II [Tumebacillus avium]